MDKNARQRLAPRIAMLALMPATLLSVVVNRHPPASMLWAAIGVLAGNAIGGVILLATKKRRCPSDGGS